LKVNVSLSQISWKAAAEFQTCSCKTHRSLWQHTSLMWQNTADDNLPRRPTVELLRVVVSPVGGMLFPCLRHFLADLNNFVQKLMHLKGTTHTFW